MDELLREEYGILQTVPATSHPIARLDVAVEIADPQAGSRRLRVALTLSYQLESRSAEAEEDILTLLKHKSVTFAELDQVRTHGRNRGGRTYFAVVHHHTFSDLFIGRRILAKLAASAGDHVASSIKVGPVTVQLARDYKDRIAAVLG